MPAAVTITMLYLLSVECTLLTPYRDLCQCTQVYATLDWIVVVSFQLVYFYHIVQIFVSFCLFQHC